MSGATPLQIEKVTNSSDQDQEDYNLLLNIFRKFLHQDNKQQLIQEMITCRASCLIDKILLGLHIDFNYALTLLRENNNSVTEKEREERKILLAAINNIIDFVSAEENIMLHEISQPTKEEDWNTCEAIFEKYNKTYAKIEDQDVEYAAFVAAWWIGIPNDSIVTYMTQGDERVRALHLSFEGTSYPKQEFPEELIPPIDFGCRCYLLSNGFGTAYASLSTEHPKIVNKIFQESLAKGGRIFSKYHPYFQKKLSPEIEQINHLLKRKLMLDENNIRSIL